MFEKHKKVIIKYLGLVLRHQPELIGLEPDECGWVDTDRLLVQMNKAGRRCSREQLETVVRLDDQERFQFNESETRIRATPGHSLDIQR